MELSFEKGAFLLLISAVVAMLSRRLRLPYSVGLVLAGIVIAVLPVAPEVSLTKELLFTVLLPPLIFQAAFDLRWEQLRRELPVVLLLAVFGVALSAAVTAAGMRYLANWPWVSALVFGVLIAATDPVSVIAAFKEAKVHGRLRLLIESESLFNDGTAAVLFAICLEILLGHRATPLDVILKFCITAGGSVICGALVAAFVLLLIGRTDDHLIEITFTTVAAYGSFLLAEHFNFSGVLATLTVGLILGSFGRRRILSARGCQGVEEFWEYAAFLANSLVFLLIGIREAHQNFSIGWLVIFEAIFFTTFARAIAVYVCCAFFAWSPLRVRMRRQHILFWGGLRGALALALALGLPEETPQREPIIAVSFAVVAFSLFVQGLTLTPLLRRFGEIPAAAQK